MSRAQHVLIAMGMAFALPSLPGPQPLTLAAQSQPQPQSQSQSAPVPRLVGTWQSSPDETPLSASYQEAVWGKGAKEIRTVRLAGRPTGDATLTVTRRVVDARGRTVKGTTSIEEAQIQVGEPQGTLDVRRDFSLTVTNAARRYPDDPAGTWPLIGLRATLTTFSDDPNRMELRLDFPDGRGSFWETLRRGVPRRTKT